MIYIDPNTKIYSKLVTSDAIDIYDVGERNWSPASTKLDCRDVILMITKYILNYQQLLNKIFRTYYV